MGCQPGGEVEEGRKGEPPHRVHSGRGLALDTGRGTGRPQSQLRTERTQRASRGPRGGTILGTRVLQVGEEDAAAVRAESAQNFIRLYLIFSPPTLH